MYTVILPNEDAPITIEAREVPYGTWFLGKLKDDNKSRLFLRNLDPHGGFQIFNENGYATYTDGLYIGPITDYRPVSVEIRVKHLV